jgi:signal transduction histidine kinase
MFNRAAKRLLVLTIVFSPVVAVAATSEEAKALLNEAVAFYETNGKDKTFAEINNRNGRFVRGELYIFVYDSDGIIAAHGADSSRIGTDTMNQQDENGKFFSREIMQVGEAGGSVDYVWLNPVTGTIQPKTSYIMLVDGFRFGCGVYK